MFVSGARVYIYILGVEIPIIWGGDQQRCAREDVFCVNMFCLDQVPFGGKGWRKPGHFNIHQLSPGQKFYPTGCLGCCRVFSRTGTMIVHILILQILYSIYNMQIL